MAGRALTAISMVAASLSNPSPLWFATRGAGAMTLVSLTAVVMLGIATSLGLQVRRTPRFVTATLHRNFSLFALALLTVHISTSVLDPFAGIHPADALIPFAGAYRPLWLGLGVLSAEVLAALIATSLLRARIGPRLWRIIHWAAYASWPLAVVHGLGTGSDAQQPWMLGLTAACAAAVLLTLGWRLLRGRLRTSPIRLASAAAVVVSTYAVCAWAAAGPLQPGWPAVAGTPAAILAAPASPGPVQSARTGFDDPLIGTLARNPSGVEISLRDMVDTELTVAILPPGPNQTLPELTVERNGTRVCTVPARAGLSIYAVCGTTRLVVTLYGSGPHVAGRLVASGPLG